MNALVTLTIGNDSMWDYTLSSMRSTCERHGWAFEAITTRKVNMARFEAPTWNVSFEKFQVCDYLDRYDRVLLIDADVMMSPECPDIFDAVPEDAIGAVFEDVGSRMKNRQGQIDMIKAHRFRGALGMDEWNTGYMNSGVMVLSKCHRPALAFDMNDPQTRVIAIRKSFPDQNTMNFLCRRSGWPILDMGYKWNHMTVFSEKWNGAPHRRDSHIIHYAGLLPEQRLAWAREDYLAWWRAGK